ncbi:MAG: polysaccharide biosynthesis C-terminal domain-containing protein [Melioribacteraceae bacterium]
MALLLPKNDLAVYQILINYILLIHAATGFIIQPYLKEIYRMNSRTLSKFSFRFTLFGFIVSVPITIALALVLEKIYGINISWQMALLSFLYIVPIFYYTIRVYILYKIKKESLILFTGISVLVVSIPLNYFLISIHKINGALIAGVIGELLSLSFYYFFEKRVGLISSTKSISNQIELSQS